MPKKNPIWCGEHWHSSKDGAAACCRTRQRSTARDGASRDTRIFSFTKDSRREIFSAIARAIALKNNPHLNQAQHDLVALSETRPELGFVRFSYLHHAVDPALVSFFIARLEIEVSVLLTEKEHRKTTKHGRRGAPKKVAELNFAARVALLCRDLLEIEPTKSRETCDSRETWGTMRGRFFAKVLRISSVSTGLKLPVDMFNKIKFAVDELPRRQTDGTDTGLYQHLGRKPKFRSFRDIDKLNGMEYEAALATLSPKQEESYLAQPKPRGKLPTSEDDGSRRAHTSRSNTRKCSSRK